MPQKAAPESEKSKKKAKKSNVFVDSEAEDDGMDLDEEDANKPSSSKTKAVNGAPPEAAKDDDDAAEVCLGVSREDTRDEN